MPQRKSATVSPKITPAPENPLMKYMSKHLQEAVVMANRSLLIELSQMCESAQSVSHPVMHRGSREDLYQLRTPGKGKGIIHDYWVITFTTPGCAFLQISALDASR
jgi:hypothetical protein